MLRCLQCHAPKLRCLSLCCSLRLEADEEPRLWSPFALLPDLTEFMHCADPTMRGTRAGLVFVAVAFQLHCGCGAGRLILGC